VEVGADGLDFTVVSRNLGNIDYPWNEIRQQTDKEFAKHMIKQASNGASTLIGRTLKQARLDKKLTQAQVAEMAGIKTGNLSKIENGKRNITLQTLLRIALAMKVSLKDIFNTPPLKHY